MKIQKLLSEGENFDDKEVEVNGWVKTCRKQKELIFISLNDGSSQDSLQIVCSAENLDSENYDECLKIKTGTSINVKGIYIKSPDNAKDQEYELSAREVKIYQICEDDFPFQKVGLSLEYMRNYPHLRHRTNLMRAVFVVKSKIMESIHNFFKSEYFHYIDLPILSTNACEGGCEPLQVTSLLKKDKIETADGKIDYSKDFFDRDVYLTVSNQLHLECFSHGLGNVYTITPTTRGESSQTTRHLAYFNMLEWEFSFGDLEANIDIAENCIKNCASDILHHCAAEIKLLDKNSGDLASKLLKIVETKFVRIEYIDAIKLLKDEYLKSKELFKEEPQIGEDLSAEQERYLVKFFDKPVAVMRYPKKIKAFYMPVSYVKDGIEYVECFDLLMDIGEVVGGSSRIWDEKELIARMEEMDISPKNLKWYVDLRRYGSVPHGGAGIGIERLTAALTGMANVKDCISFPITVHNCSY